MEHLPSLMGEDFWDIEIELMHFACVTDLNFWRPEGKLWWTE